MSQHSVVLLLGSNLGNTRKNIDQALLYIEFEVGQIICKSDYLKTNPVEFDSCNIFCNIATQISTHLSPFMLLKMLKKFEENFGRKEDSTILGKYSDRIIDLDIVKYDGIIFKSTKLILPHFKHTIERDFSKKLISQLENN
jgi:2-amino-4-hydroxy-6-hydroxymethyldihydropteridine diphosphokinase